MLTERTDKLLLSETTTMGVVRAFWPNQSDEK